MNLPLDSISPWEIVVHRVNGGMIKIDEGVPAGSSPRIYGDIGRKEGERGFERLLYVVSKPFQSLKRYSP